MNNHTLWSNYTRAEGNQANHTRVILYSILLICSLLGNILVIAVVFGNRKLRTNFNHLIVNMAISDLFIPLLILPKTIVEEMNGREWLVDGPLGEAFCKLYFFLTDISPAVSVFSLVIIAVNRYISIAYPMKSQIFSKKKSCVLISITWITSAALFSPYLYIFRLHGSKSVGIRCGWTWLPAFDNVKASIIYYSIVTAVIFVIPLVAIVMMYSLMAYKIKVNSRNIAGMLNSKQARRRRNMNKNIFYVSIVIVCCFVFLWGPYHCFAVIYISGNIPQSFDFHMIAFVVYYLGYLNSAVNPCVYFIFLKHFRQGLKNLSARRKRKGSMNSLTSKKPTSWREESGRVKMNDIVHY